MKLLSMNKKTKLFLIIAFSWTWFGWIAAYWISHINGSVLITDSTLFSLLTDTWGIDRFLPQILFAIAVYGPFIGFIFTTGFGNLRNYSGKIKSFWPYIFLIPLIAVLPSIILSALTGLINSENLSFATGSIAVLAYLASNLITSGTEEFGWRGVLYPDLKASGMSFWENAWKGGFIWALWHFPLLFIMYLPLGIAVLVPSLIGFTASIVAMNYITNFLYEKMENIWAVVLLHALNNTMSFLVILLFPGTPFTIFTNLMAWVIVWWIEKKHNPE